MVLVSEQLAKVRKEVRENTSSASSKSKGVSEKRSNGHE